MSHRDLFMSREEEDGPEWLTDHQRYRFSRPASEADITTKAMCELMDQNAESENMHDFVGAHAALVRIITEEVGPQSAYHVMRRLVDEGGLQEIAR